MRKMCVSVLFLFGLWSPAIAESALMGPGTTNCSGYLDDVKGLGDQARNFYFSWTQGFMSGINAMLLEGSGTSTDLSVLKPEQQIYALEQHCKSHPDDPYVRGVIILLDVMRQQQNLPDWRTTKKAKKSF